MRFILSGTHKPCIICAKSTTQIDIYSESYMCSYKCAEILDEEIQKTESEGEVI